MVHSVFENDGFGARLAHDRRRAALTCAYPRIRCEGDLAAPDGQLGAHKVPRPVPCVRTPPFRPTGAGADVFPASSPDTVYFQLKRAGYLTVSTLLHYLEAVIIILN